MKYVCIENIDHGFAYDITIGKIYDVIDSHEMTTSLSDTTYYIIIDDDGDKKYIKSHLFEYIDKIREEKLNNLGIK